MKILALIRKMSSRKPFEFNNYYNDEELPNDEEEPYKLNGRSYAEIIENLYSSAGPSVLANHAIERFQDVVYQYKVLQRGRNPTINSILKQITEERPDELKKVKEALLREATAATNTKLRKAIQFELNRPGMGGRRLPRKTHRRKSHKRRTHKRRTSRRN